MAKKERDTLRQFERIYNEHLTVAYCECEDENEWIAFGMKLAYKILFDISDVQFELDMMKLRNEQ